MQGCQVRLLHAGARSRRRNARVVEQSNRLHRKSHAVLCLLLFQPSARDRIYP